MTVIAPVLKAKSWMSGVELDLISFPAQAPLKAHFRYRRSRSRCLSGPFG